MPFHNGDRSFRKFTVEKCDKPSLRSGRSREWRPFVRESSVQRDLKSDFAQFRIMVDRGRGIRLYVSRTGCILLGERVGCIPLSKGYRANLNIGRSAVPSGDLPRNRATRSPTCDPFCSFVRSTRPIIFSFLLRCAKRVSSRYFDESGAIRVENHLD